MAHPKRKISKTRRDKRRTHYKASTQTISLDFIQSFENSERSFVKGQIFYERPNLFKISTSKPTKTDLIVNGTEAFRTDYQLNETIKYELEKLNLKYQLYFF